MASRSRDNLTRILDSIVGAARYCIVSTKAFATLVLNDNFKKRLTRLLKHFIGVISIGFRPNISVSKVWHCKRKKYDSSGFITRLKLEKRVNNKTNGLLNKARGVTLKLSILQSYFSPSEYRFSLHAAETAIKFKYL